MKYVLLLTLIGLTGCQTRRMAPPLPRPASLDPRPIAMTVPAAPETTDGRTREIRRQTQLIEALVSENDALTAKLAAAAKGKTSSLPQPSGLVPVAVAPEKAGVVKVKPEKPQEASAAVAARAVTPADELSDGEPVLMPSADGVIDIAGALAGNGTGEPVNPFAVRVASSEPAHEITLRVDGVIEGMTAGAVINDEVVETGEMIDGLWLERIEPDAVVLREGDERLRIPVAGKPTRVRLAL